MKKMLVVLISTLMVMSLAACGGKSDTESASSKVAPPAASSSSAPAEEKTETVPVVEEENTSEDTLAEDENTPEEQAYADAMSEFIVAYEELVETTGMLLNDYDGSDEWFASFTALYQASNEAGEQLIAANVPASYEESHISITAAVSSFSAMMDAFGQATDAYKSGDEAGGDELIEQARVLYGAAQELWEEAIVTE